MINSKQMGSDLANQSPLGKQIDNNILSEALRFCKLGFSVHWLRRLSKQPLEQGWTILPKKTVDELLSSYKFGYNLGCRTGSPSQFDDGTCLLIIDCDLKGGDTYKDEAFCCVRKFLGEDLSIYPKVTSGRGYHFYVRCPIALLPNSQKLGRSSKNCVVSINGKEEQRPSWEVELLSIGKQAVIPLSIHPDTHKPYQWLKPINDYHDIPLLNTETLSSLQNNAHHLNRERKTPDIGELRDIELDQLQIPSHLKSMIKEGVLSGQRSDALFKVSLGLLQHGINETDICSLLTDSRYGLSKKPLEERKSNRASAAQWVLKYCIAAAKASLSEPEPLRKATIKPAEPPINALGEKLSEIVLAVSEIVQAPKALVMQSFLAVASLTVQPHANVIIDGRKVPLSLFFLSIALSGDRKTSVDAIALQPVKEYQKALIERFQHLDREYQIKLSAQEAKRKTIIKAAKNKNLNDLEDDLANLDELEKPRFPLLLTEEPTYEGLIKQLEQGSPAIGLFSSEGGRFLGGQAMNSDNRLKTAAGLCSLWDGESINKVRSGEGVSVLYGRRLACHLMMQPVVASQWISDELLNNQGFTARFLVSAPTSIAGTRAYKAQNDEFKRLCDHYSWHVKKLLQHEASFNKKTGELNLRNIILTPAAKDVWIKAHDDIEKQLGTNGRFSPIYPFAAKAAEQVLRIAGVLTLFNNINANSIDEKMMANAVELIQFYLDEALRLHSDTVVNPDIALAEKVLEYIKDKFPQGFSLPDIYQNLSAIRDKSTAKRIIKILQDHGWIASSPPGVCNGIKRKEVWRLTSFKRQG